MKLNNHLLYIDITQICGIGCEFCMYSDKHTMKENLILTDKSRKNISDIINHSEIKSVSISGEGEPLNNINAFKEILSLSKGGIAFEFITSGFLSHDKLITFYEDVHKIITKNGDTCNIRLSTDSYHIKKLKYKPHGISIKYFLDKKLKNLTFSFRSIDIDKEFTRKYIYKELQKLDISSKIETQDVLEDHLFIDNNKFSIDYKNLVKPSLWQTSKYMNLKDYIKAKEKRLGKIFTLGNINTHPYSNGMGITIKPNGDVFFYGIDSNLLGNIHSDILNIDFFKNIVKENSMINELYTTPFMTIVNRISISDNVKKLIEDTNNPYWIIKEIMNYDKSLLNKISSND